MMVSGKRGFLRKHFKKIIFNIKFYFLNEQKLFRHKVTLDPVMARFGQDVRKFVMSKKKQLTIAILFGNLYSTFITLQ